MSLSDCKLLSLNELTDERGKLAYLETNDVVPFDIARIYYLYDVPKKSSRGAHAHKKLEQIMIAISGSFDVKLNDGENESIFHLRRPNEGLYIGREIWRDIYNFSEDGVCLVLASLHYTEDDYIRKYDDFIKYIES